MLVLELLTEAFNEAEDAAKPITVRGEPCVAVSCADRELTLHMGCSI